MKAVTRSTFVGLFVYAGLSFAGWLAALAREAARPTGALRVATPADIVVGALLWYEREEDGDEGNPHYWCIVEDVLRPSDAWKAFTAHDGCRYGLDGAMVEVLDHIGDPNEQA